VLAAVQLNADGLAFGCLGALDELIDLHVAICARLASAALTAALRRRVQVSGQTVSAQGRFPPDGA